MHQLRQWNFSADDQKLVFNFLKEWYSNRFLTSVLSQWENNSIIMSNSVNASLKLIYYNV
jgi:hypothetical protein